MQTIRCIISSLSLLLLCSCATISREQCVAPNWSELGKEDALRGHAAQILEHQKECAKYHGIVGVAGGGYTEGYAEGLRIFCTIDGGFKHGKKGRRFLKTCPKETELEFLRGYAMGVVVYRALGTARRAEQRADEAEKKATETQRTKRSQTEDLMAKGRKHRRDEERKARERGLFGRK